ncbi:MAG TPA: amidohydrolase [Verrucomicrobiales bacterium]|nr:amidohydrolase [Verrucomicrobiales bacterium]
MLAMPAAAAEAAEPIIDIHQHLHYSGRSDGQFVAHQLALGVTTTILLPAGRPVKRPSTHDGSSNGLAAEISGNEAALALARREPERYRCFANEVADLPDALAVIRPFLEAGAIGIGEQKFGVQADSPHIEAIAGLAREFRVPVLLHFQHGMYNLGIDRFHKVLEKFPDVNFIGHAQTWWGNIDKNHRQEVMYPAGRVTPGGITDRLLAGHPNMFGDTSAGSGLNALIRDEEHTRGFLERHQDKLLFGSDCNDTIGRGPGCQGAQILAAIRRLSPSKEIERKILFENSRRLFRLG